MREIYSEDFGTVRIHQIPVPEGIYSDGAIYTYSGRVAIPYRRAGESHDYIHIATVNDDGSDWLEIYDGPCKLDPMGNGFRFMPFPDNKRALIGDYVFECEPDMDHADITKSRMVPMKYPEALVKMPMLWKVWSEIVISPDNEHMAWNGLGAMATAYVGKLRRTEDAYELDNVRTVGNLNSGKPDPDHEGCILLEPVRGGETKQFTRGGLALTYVGMDRGPGDSMMQDLDTERVVALTNTPGYDETTIVSPDNELGITMSTRFSPKTNCAVIGMIPRRGNLLTKSQLAMNVYLYGVASVRAYKEGNIGPALIDLKRSQNDLNYMGTDLSDPEGKWVYYSPMSWHPTSRKCAWNEGIKKTLGDDMRVMVAELVDRPATEPVPAEPLPEVIPYAHEGIYVDMAALENMQKGYRVAGKYSGTVETRPSMGEQYPKMTTVYENFSDDGETFIDGWESAESAGLTKPGNTTYDADIRAHGAHNGEMKLHLVFERTGLDSPVNVSTESKGYASYDDVTVHVEDMF